MLIICDYIKAKICNSLVPKNTFNVIKYNWNEKILFIYKNYLIDYIVDSKKMLFYRNPN